MWISARRASAILFNYLRSINGPIEFLVPANVCPIVLATFEKAGVNYQLIDVDEKSLCIDQKLVENFLGERSGHYGILFVRTFGYLADVESWFESLKRAYPHIRIIDDRCLCQPTLNENMFSRCSDLTLFSTGYSKFVELGFGGLGYIRDNISSNYQNIKLHFSENDHDTLVKRVSHAIHERQPFEYNDSGWLDLRPLNHSISDYIDLIRVRVESAKRQKAKLNCIYESIIPERWWLGREFNDWRFSVLLANKNDVIREIFDSGFFASSHYASMSGIFKKGTAPVAEKIHSRILNLFNDHRISPESAEFIAQIVRKIGVL